MRIGKLTNQQLKDIVLSKLHHKHDVLLGSGVGEDCAALDFNGEACVLSTDPITGACENVGALAVHVSGNDIASSGAQPVAMLVTLLVPPDKEMIDVEKVVEDLIKTADTVGIDIVGGHTEVTDAVTRIVVSTTVIGRTPSKSLVKSSGAKIGDAIIMTKAVAMEGTYILACDQKEKLKKVLSEQDFEIAMGLGSKISVIKEGITAGRNGATAMHDITEGGVLGAVYELCEASGVGCVLNIESIPVLSVTKKICNYFDINPYRLIGSGSMLITATDGDRTMDALAETGVDATVIGRITESNICMIDDGQTQMIKPPEADELFSVL